MDIEVITETPSVEQTSTEVEQGTQTESANVEDVPVVEEFIPDYKYKAYGKEYEMDEWARPLLNKETQPHLTKLFEKAGGFDPLKQGYESMKQEFGTYKQAYSELDGARNKIVSSVEKGDLASVFKILGVDKNQIREFVKQDLLYEGMSPEQRRAIDEKNQLTQSQALYQEQLTEQQRYTENLIMEKHEMEIGYTFSNPKYAPLIESYNQRNADPNAFRTVVDRIGAYEFNINKRNISVADAVEQAVKMLGMGSEVQSNPQVQNTNASNVQAPGKPSPKPIVVPNGGSGGSPVKKRPMSIADLEKEAQQLNAN